MDSRFNLLAGSHCWHSSDIETYKSTFPNPWHYPECCFRLGPGLPLERCFILMPFLISCNSLCALNAYFFSAHNISACSYVRMTYIHRVYAPSSTHAHILISCRVGSLPKAAEVLVCLRGWKEARSRYHVHTVNVRHARVWACTSIVCRKIWV